MNKMLKNDNGSSLVEYALLIAIVAGLALAGLHSLGNSMNTTMTKSASLLTSTGFTQTASNTKTPAGISPVSSTRK